MIVEVRLSRVTQKESQHLSAPEELSADEGVRVTNGFAGPVRTAPKLRGRLEPAMTKSTAVAGEVLRALAIIHR